MIMFALSFQKPHNFLLNQRSLPESSCGKVAVTDKVLRYPPRIPLPDVHSLYNLLPLSTDRTYEDDGMSFLQLGF